MLTIPIFDEGGRELVAPRQVPDARPAGVWDTNTDAREIVRVCCGCPDKAQREDEAHALGKVCSHYFCSACVAEWDRQAAAFFAK